MLHFHPPLSMDVPSLQEGTNQPVSSGTPFFSCTKLFLSSLRVQLPRLYLFQTTFLHPQATLCLLSSALGDMGGIRWAAKHLISLFAFFLVSPSLHWVPLCGCSPIKSTAPSSHLKGSKITGKELQLPNSGNTQEQGRVIANEGAANGIS